MKKSLFALLLLLPALGFAQKQSDGAVVAELNFTPLGDTPLSLEGIKLRFFAEDVFCIRTQLNIASSSSDSVLFQAGALESNGVTNSDAVMFSRKTFDFSFAPGVEFHFDDADRLSPYIGAYFLIGSGSTRTETGEWGPIQSSTTNDPETWKNWRTIHTTPYSRLGFGLVTGADFYFADYIYLGVEFGFVYDRVKTKDTDITFSTFRGYQLAVNPVDPDAVTTPASLTNGTSSSFGPSVNGAIRLGYVFGR